MNWPIRCERGGRNVLFLSINLSCRRSRGIVLVMASSAREMDSAGRSEIQRKICEMLAFQC